MSASSSCSPGGLGCATGGGVGCGEGGGDGAESSQRRPLSSLRFQWCHGSGVTMLVRLNSASSRCVHQSRPPKGRRCAMPMLPPSTTGLRERISQRQAPDSYCGAHLGAGSRASPEQSGAPAACSAPKVESLHAARPGAQSVPQEAASQGRTARQSASGCGVRPLQMPIRPDR
jgi:hypothetical protein